MPIRSLLWAKYSKTEKKKKWILNFEIESLVAIWKCYYSLNGKRVAKIYITVQKGVCLPALSLSINGLGDKTYPMHWGKFKTNNKALSVQVLNHLSSD